MGRTGGGVAGGRDRASKDGGPPGPPFAFGLPLADGIEALDDDLNTPAALAALNRLARETQQAGEDDERGRLAAALRASGALLGLLQDAEGWTALRAARDDVDSDEIDRLVAQRAEARERRDFAEADRIRDELDARGIELEDTADGTRWRIKTRTVEA